MSKLIKDFYGVPAGEIYPRTIAAGEECPANLEKAALQAGALPPDESAEQGPEKKEPEPEPETGAKEPEAEAAPTTSDNAEPGQTASNADDKGSKSTTGKTGK